MAKKILIQLITIVFLIWVFIHQWHQKNELPFSGDYQNKEQASKIEEIRHKTNNPKLSNKPYSSGINEEWKRLNSKLLVRRQAVYYFVDEEAFKIIVVTDKFFSTKLLFGIKFINLKHNTVKYANLTKYTTEKVHFLNVFQQAQFVITVPFQYQLIDDFTNITNIAIKMTFYDTFNNKTNTPIDVPIKSKKKYLSTKPKDIKRTVLCTKNFYLNTNQFESFKWWVRIHKTIGYSKIIIYNTSIPTEKYQEFIEKQNGFIEIRNFQKIPKMIKGKLRTVTYSRIERGEASYAQENIPIAECFLTTFSDYDRVAIYDLDELIIPAFEDEKPQLEDIRDTLIFDNLNCNNNINTYMDEISNEQPIKLWQFSANFRHKLVVEPPVLSDIYEQLSKFLSTYTEFNQSSNFSIFYEPRENDLIFTINNKKQFKYAQDIFKAIGLYYKDRGDLKKYDSNLFNRAFRRSL